MKQTLSFQTIKAVFWSVIEALSNQGIRFIIGIILARLLLPEQYGIIGMLAIFIAVSQSIMESGFRSAIIQRTNLTDIDTSTVFYCNILLGIFLTGVLIATSPLIARFYNQPILVKLLRLMSLNILIDSFGIVQSALLIKKIDFKTQTKISLISIIASGAVGIILAYKGFGVWSLAVQQLSNTLIRNVLLWSLSKWRPLPAFSIESLKSLFGYSSKILFSGLLNTIFNNIYTIVIGRLFSPAELGYFVKADNLQKMVSTTMTSVVSRVSFPVFSTIQNDKNKLRDGLKRSIQVLVFVNFPIMIGLAIVARPLVVILFTEKWLSLVPYFQLLCLVGLMRPLHVMNLTILQAIGRSDLFLRLEIIKKAFVVLNIVVTWRWGVLAMIYGQIVVSFLSYYVNAFYSKRLLNYGMVQQFKDLSLYLFVTIIMGLSVYCVQYLNISSNFLLLTIEVSVGVIVYIILSHLMKLPAYKELKSMLRKSR